MWYRRSAEQGDADAQLEHTPAVAAYQETTGKFTCGSAWPLPGFIGGEEKMTRACIHPRVMLLPPG